MFSQVLDALRSTSSLITGLWNDPSVEAGTDSAALPDLHHRLTVRLDQLRAWNPAGGQLRTLKDSCEGAESRILTLRTVNDEWATFMDTLDSEVQFYQEIWEQLPGLSQRRIDRFAWTLTEPLEQPYDLLVLEYVSDAQKQFKRAWDSFQHGYRTAAIDLHGFAMTDCDLAESVIRCYQYGTPQQKEKLQALYLQADVSMAATRQFQAYLREAPWDHNLCQGGPFPASLMPPPPIPPRRPPATAGTSLAASATSTPTPTSLMAAAASSPAATLRAETPLLERLMTLDLTLQGRGTSAGRELQAHSRADGTVRAGLRRLDPTQIRTTELDPDSHLSLRLAMLEALATSQQAAPSPSYLASLQRLEADVERARAAQQQLRDAREAVINLKKVVKADPATQQTLTWMVEQAEKLQKAAADAGKAGQLALKAERASECLTLATKAREKARQIQQGLWPDAEAQLQRCSSLRQQLAQVKNGPAPLIQDRLRQRFKAQEWAFHTADDAKQAQRMLQALSATLNTVRALGFHQGGPQA